jgi:hypothetical protein
MNDANLNENIGEHADAVDGACTRSDVDHISVMAPEPVHLDPRLVHCLTLLAAGVALGLRVPG